jgi:hypothetical protein
LKMCFLDSISTFVFLLESLLYFFQGFYKSDDLKYGFIETSINNGLDFVVFFSIGFEDLLM